MTIGAYDGVHVGHQALLAELGRRADAHDLETVVITFDRHPATVVRPDSAPLLLCDLDQKLELLAAAGVARTVVLPFDEERAAESAEEFVEEVLVRGVRARVVAVGEDFHFGHGRRGTVAMLREMGSEAGFEVDGVGLWAARAAGTSGPVSSTRIRGLVADGRVDEAAVLLGRWHQVRGPVVHGDARGGAELGFPTANVAVPEGIALPAVGIYAGWYEGSDGVRRPAALSIGRRPTFYDGGGDLLLEAFLLDFSGDLYGDAGRVSFVERIRDELRFDSVDELVDRIGDDVARTRSILGTP